MGDVTYMRTIMLFFFYKCLAGKPERTRPLERSRRRLYNIKMDLKVIKWEGVDFFQVISTG
jgi:hypothetical protein